MQRDGKFVLKFICYGLLTVLVYLLETGTPLHRVRLLDVSVDVLACLPAAAALFEGPALGAAIGFLTGLLYDLAGTAWKGCIRSITCCSPRWPGASAAAGCAGSGPPICC